MVKFFEQKGSASFEDQDYDDYKSYNKSFGSGGNDETDIYNMRDIIYDGPCGTQATLDKYSKYYEEDVKPEDIKKGKKLVEDEIHDAQKDIDDAMKDVDFLSAKEKKAMKRVLYKRLETIKKSFMEELDSSANGFKSWIDDIDTEVEDKISEFKDAVAAILDIDTTSYTIWPKKDREYTTSLKRNYASDIPVTVSDQILKIKLDKKSLEEFLCQSDGDLENIAMITADNREFKDVENVVFKIAHIDSADKKRQHAFTEADGKAISDMLDKGNLTKCGWIHTHPFGKTSVFFSGTDDVNTKEMCVFPDDYSLAIVVGCKYSDPVTFLKDGSKVISECEVEWSLGSMLYRKQVPDQTGPIRLNADPKSMLLIKYPIDIEIVDDDGKTVEYKNLSQDNSILEDVKSTFTPAIQYGLEQRTWMGSWECG